MGELILGISAFYHDAAAALVRDGDIVAAAQEERFTRRKNDPRFPQHAINYCLEEAFVEPAELSAIAYYDRPLLTLDRVVRSSAAAGADGVAQFVEGSRSILGRKLWLRDHVTAVLGEAAAALPLLVTEHHVAHAASAFYPSPFDTAAIITLDGVGEWATTTVGIGTEAGGIELWQQIEYPHSLGLLYSAFTYFCGFKVNSGEYKLMGLAPYGRPRYRSVILEHLIDLKEDGSFRLNPAYLGYLDGLTMTNERFAALFGGPPRVPESRITQREMDLAASIQDVLQEAVLRIARHARRSTGMRHVVLAGGVALNCVANGLILRERVFDDIWIQPAAGDAGGALGAALFVAHQVRGRPRSIAPGRDRQQNSLLGPAYSSAEVRAFLDRHRHPYTVVEDPHERARVVANALAAGQVVGFFSGRMEFGPRALGARSILANPLLPDTQAKVNLKIKFRESFRPFAPAVLLEDAAEYFELERESPYMLIVAPVRSNRRRAQDVEPRGEDLLAVVNRIRSDIPAVTHVDYSARVQTVRRDAQPDFHRVIEAFRAATGYGLLVNTSFNVRGEPIVCTPDDAFRCFMSTDMDLLVLEDCVLRKAEQPTAAASSMEPAGAVDTGSAADVDPDTALRAMFHDVLLPIARRIGDPLAERLALEFPPPVASCYRDRRRGEETALETGDWASPAELAAALTTLWHDAPQLALLAQPLAEHAFSLRSTAPQADRVDPFLYAMF